MAALRRDVPKAVGQSTSMLATTQSVGRNLLQIYFGINWNEPLIEMLIGKVPANIKQFQKNAPI